MSLTTLAMKRGLLPVVALAAVVAACSGQASSEPAGTAERSLEPGPTAGRSSESAPRVARKCPLTKPNGATPPFEEPNATYHGNGDLWTAFPLDGMMDVVRERGEVHPDGSLEFKFGWSVQVPGKLAITGRRLDASAPPLRARILPGYEGIFKATSVIFPTEGCWKVTGRAGTASLTFVVLVVG